MQKIVIALLTVAFYSVNAESTENTAKDDNEFIELGEPCKYVSGAYYGLGLGVSHISHKVNALKNNVGKVSMSKSSNQYDLSLIAGFGSAFYKRYYAGIELEMFKRFKGSNSGNDELTVVFPSTIGMNMDVRFGYQLPENGSLVYLTAGFARVLGKTAFAVTTNNRKHKTIEVSHGSFYPTFGVGLEYKVNHNWNVRGDFRFSITSKDDNKYVRVNNSTWKFDAKPSRIAFRISVTRNIGTSFFR